MIFEWQEFWTFLMILLVLSCVSPLYTSHKQMMIRPYNEEYDIWGLGYSILQSCVLKPHFIGKDEQWVKSVIISGLDEDWPDEYSCELNSVINRIITVYPNHKPSASELLCERRIHSMKEKNELKYCLRKAYPCLSSRRYEWFFFIKSITTTWDGI